MALTPTKLWGVTQLGTAEATLYTSTSPGQTILTNVTVTNVDTAVVSFTIYKVANGGTADTSNLVISAYNLSPGQDYSPLTLKKMQLAAGETIHGKASKASSINTTGSGLVF